MLSNRTNANIQSTPIICSSNQVPLLSKFDLNDRVSFSRMNDMIYPHDCASGFDYIEHIILPENTLQGICIQYKISPVLLRQSNNFSGSTLLLAPKRLIIPLRRSKNKFPGGVKLQDQTTEIYKIHKILAECPSLKEEEARTYLHINNWKVIEGVAAAREGIEKKSNYEEEEFLSTKSLSACCEKRFRYKAIEEEKSEMSSEKQHVELKIMKKFGRKSLTKLSNGDDFDECTVNYIVEAISRTTTIGIMKHQIQKSNCKRASYKFPVTIPSRTKQSHDQLIDFGIELKDLSS